MTAPGLTPSQADSWRFAVAHMPAGVLKMSGWTITNVAAGHSGGNSFGARLAVAVAERLSLGCLQVWRDRPH